MLRRWTSGNFKAVAGETTLDLAPITILCEANSSGNGTVELANFVRHDDFFIPEPSRA